MTTHPLWQPFQLVDPAEVDSRLLTPGRTGEITVVPPDPGWPAAFERIRTRIIGALGPSALAVEHVGSTAVPGLWAKPIIDVELIVADSAAEDDYLAAIGSGWIHAGHSRTRVGGTPAARGHRSAQQRARLFP
jgi:GrpB-like predicted nucleotidyltransferase (UPF0157 family)